MKTQKATRFASSDEFFEGLAELDGGDVVVDFAFDGIGYGPSFLADDDADHIELLGDPDGTSVAKPEVGVDVDARSDGEDATGGEDSVAADNDGAIVERRILVEKLLEKSRRGKGINTLTGADDIVDLVLTFEDDKSASFAGRHVHTGLDVGFEIGAAACVVALDVALPELEALKNILAGDAGVGAHHEEETTDFGLEDHHESDETHVDHSAKDGAREAHTEGIDDSPENDDHKNGPKNLHGIGAFDKFVDLIDEECNKQNVNDVADKNVGHRVGNLEVGDLELRG